MNTLKEWAEYYQRMRVWVYPYMSQEQPWTFWKNKKDQDYKNLSDTWTWNDDIGLKLIVGKKGIKVLELRDKNLLEQALSLLGLPEDYPWIIEKEDTVAIVIDTPSISVMTKGMTNRSYEKILLLWEGYYVVPSSNTSFCFYKNRQPEEHPIQVDDNTLLSCVEQLVNQENNKKIVFTQEEANDIPGNSQTPKRKLWKTILSYALYVIGILFLMMLAGVVPIVGIPIIIVFFYVNWDKLFKKKKNN